MNITIKYIIQNHDTGISAVQNGAGKLAFDANSQQIKKEDRGQPRDINIDLDTGSLKEELLPILNNVVATYIRTKYPELDDQKNRRNPDGDFSQELKDMNKIVKEFLGVE